MHAKRDIVLTIPSVRLSVSKRMDISSHFCDILQVHHPSFLSPTAFSKFQRKPLSGALNARGWENLEFSPLISETVRDRPIVIESHR